MYFIKSFFCIYWYDHVIFVFPFIYVMYYVYWFVDIEPSLHPWDESHLIVMYDLFDVLLDAVCQHFVENFSIQVHQQYCPVVFLSLFCLYLVLGLEWCWLHKKSSVFLDFLDSYKWKIIKPTVTRKNWGKINLEDFYYFLSRLTRISIAWY